MKYNKVEDSSLTNYKKDLCDYFQFISEAIQLEDVWTKDKAVEIEKKKSFVRGILRYSPDSIKLTQKLKHIIKSKFNFSNNLNWITLPYPMIHLGNDLVEALGGFHYDYNLKDKKNFFTLWTQITNYEYSGLSLVNENIFINLFPRLFLKSGLLNFFSRKLTTNMDYIYLWTGNQIHKGNFNSSLKKSCAIQLKITEDIYEFEQVQSLNDNGTFNETYYKYTKDELKKLYKEYSKIIDEILNYKFNDDVFNLVSKLLINLNKNMSLSFAFSVFSQRVFSANKLFRIENLGKKIQALDSISLLIGSANLIAFKRLESTMNLNINEIFQNLKLIDKLKCMPYETCHLNKILKIKNYNNYKKFNF